MTQHENVDKETKERTYSGDGGQIFDLVENKVDLPFGLWACDFYGGFELSASNVYRTLLHTCGWKLVSISYGKYLPSLSWIGHLSSTLRECGLQCSIVSVGTVSYLTILEVYVMEEGERLL